MRTPEPDEAKVSSPVLRGVGSREAPLLPGPKGDLFMSRVLFPKIYELRDSMNNPDCENSCLKNLDIELEGQGATHAWSIIEHDLQELDHNAWVSLKSEALQAVNSWDQKSCRDGSPRGREALLNILYQAKAYRYLKTKGCSAIGFIPRAEKNGFKTPDLEGICGLKKVLCEVKTINESEDEVHRQRVEKKYLHKDFYLNDSFFDKLTKTISTAKKQLCAYDSTGNAKHIVYIILNFDDFWGDHKEASAKQLDDYLSDHPEKGIELVFHNLFTAFNRTLSLSNATVVDDGE